MKDLEHYHYFKSAVAFFFLFFLHGTAIGTRQQGIWIGVAVASFAISYFWVGNVKKANIATKRDQIIYSLGAMSGAICGLLTTPNI